MSTVNVIPMRKAEPIQNCKPIDSNNRSMDLGHTDMYAEEDGKNMSDYVTREELNHAVDKLSSKIEVSEAHEDTRFVELNGKLDQIPDKIKLALNDYDEKQRQSHKETIRFLSGTILLGIVTILVSIFF